MNLKLIVNPVAGGDARVKAERIRDCLEAEGCQVDMFLTEASGDAAAAAADAAAKGYDRIVAAGGDGTLREVINGLAPSSIPLAFLPLGTTNVFALEVGLPVDVESACTNVLKGEVRPVSLGRADHSRFLLMAGIGFDAEVVRRVDLRLKRWVGKLAYLVSAVRMLLSYPRMPIEVENEDGEISRGYGAIVGNARFYGGRFSITPEASLEEPLLHVCLFRKGDRFSLIRSAATIAFGGRLKEPDVQFIKTRRLRINGTGVPVQVDGDFLGELPMTFEATPNELFMVLPSRG